MKKTLTSKLREAGITNRLMRRVTMKMQLDEMEGYVANVERGFKRQLKASERKWKKHPKGMSNEELEGFFEKLSQECFALDRAFPNLIRQTSFIYLYSVIEKGLMFLCECAHKYGKLPEAPENHKGRGIRRAYSYLTKIGGVAVPEGREWNELCLLGGLRNRFVHGLSRKPLDPTLKGYIIKKRSLIRIGNSNQIILLDAFCPHFVKLVRRFYANVLNAIPDTYLE